MPLPYGNSQIAEAALEKVGEWPLLPELIHSNNKKLRNQNATVVVLHNAEIGTQHCRPQTLRRWI
jgi:hypothetical protein